MNRRTMIIIGIIVLFLVGGGLWLANTSNQSTQPSTSGTTETQTVTPTVSPESNSGSNIGTDDGVEVVEVEGGSFYFQPNEIRVKKGQPVKVVLKSVSLMHSFVIDELGVSMPIVQNGNTGTVEFTADKVGTFEYYCRVSQHRQNGQVGKLTVEE